MLGINGFGNLELKACLNSMFPRLVAVLVKLIYTTTIYIPNPNEHLCLVYMYVNYFWQ